MGGLVLALALSLPAPVAAQQFFTKSELLADMFATASRVEPVTLAVKPRDQRRAREVLGGPLPLDEYVFYRALRDGEVVGYCLFDDQMGQNEPITFGVQLDTEGTVLRVEVVTYREDGGQGITNGGFRSQFEGKDHDDPLSLGQDIVAVSGATYSSRATTVVVRRASFLTRLLVEKEEAESS
jgi:Na+-translocating ferredoxin:NAD+ oxidoreductase RnfG subunit